MASTVMALPSLVGRWKYIGTLARLAVAAAGTGAWPGALAQPPHTRAVKPIKMADKVFMMGASWLVNRE
jgi:hypothetical protein